MRMSVVFLGALLLSGCEPDRGAANGASGAAPDDVFAVVAEADRLALRELWPGFDPGAIPVAIFDGERTLLFRHPAPPADFQAVPGRDGVWTYPGRHSGVTANSSAEIGGIPTATLMPASGDASVRDRAGTLIHEAFHVHQGRHHPGWQANEVEVFTYPVDDPGLLALRRLETEALRRALAATRPVEAACWGRAALTVRMERFRNLSPGAVGYERATELYEGLAHYVEHGATEGTDEGVLPDDAFPPDAVRLRAYATGAAFARLLDRFSPSWKGELDPDGSISLDVLLSGVLGPPDTGGAVCELGASERRRIEHAARGDVETLRIQRIARRGAFLERPGWTLVVEAPGAPFFPQGFDPLNVEALQPGEVLHRRWLRLGNGAGTVEVLGHEALTHAAGDHPLFNGVHRLTVTGLPAEPSVAEENGVVTVLLEGMTAEVRGARVEREGQGTTIRLLPPG